MKFYKIFKSELSQIEIDNVKKFYDPTFLRSLNISSSDFKLTHESIPKNDSLKTSVNSNKIAHSESYSN